MTAVTQPVDLSQFRRSCQPNAIKVIALQPNGTIKFKIQANARIQENDMITLMFEDDYKESNTPLNCYFHQDKEEQCPFEVERLAHQAEMKRAKKRKTK